MGALINAVYAQRNLPVVTPEEVARLAVLGIRVVAQQPDTLPKARLIGEPASFLTTDYGAVAGVYFATDGGTRVEPTMRYVLNGIYTEQFGYRIGRSVPREWTMTDFLNVFERLATRFEEMKTPRIHFGSAWALHCVLHYPSIATPRKLKHVTRAVKRVSEAGVSPDLFYRTLIAVKGSKMLERTVEASIFRLANPGLHPALAGELFR